MLNKPLIQIPVDHFKIRQWEYVPSFFDIYKNIYIVTLEAFQRYGHLMEESCIHQLLAGVFEFWY